MQPQFVPPSMPAAGAPQDQLVVAAGLYSHAEQKPMLIELGDAGHVRCTTIVRSAKTGKRRLRRTKWHGSYLTSENANGEIRLDMVFSCKLKPSIQPVSTFDWDAELSCWRNTEVLMYSPPPCMWQLFKAGYPLLEGDDCECDEWGMIEAFSLEAIDE